MRLVRFPTGYIHFLYEHGLRKSTPLVRRTSCGNAFYVVLQSIDRRATEIVRI